MPADVRRRHLRDLFIAFDAARFQLHIHVIGDGATRSRSTASKPRARSMALAQPASAGPCPGIHRSCDIPRLHELGVVANIQPLWARHEPSVTDVAPPMIGAARGRWMYPWRFTIAAGAPYAVSSDWGVSTLNPFPIMQTAVTRLPERAPKGHLVFEPDERITVEDGAATLSNAAAVAWRGDETGSLTPEICRPHPARSRRVPPIHSRFPRPRSISPCWAAARSTGSRLRRLRRAVSWSATPPHWPARSTRPRARWRRNRPGCARHSGGQRRLACRSPRP